MGEHEKAGVYKMLSDRKLLGTVTMAKQFNRYIVLEFYANLKSNIFVAQSPNFHKVIVRSYVFNFSPKLISDYLNCKIVKSHKKKELDFVLDMNKVILELTENSIAVWPDKNKVLSLIFQ